MYVEKFLPEGLLIHSTENRAIISGSVSINTVLREKRIIEGIAILCDEKRNLTIDFGSMRGIIPYQETALGLENGKTRDIAIISRVGKPVSCIITDIMSDGTLLLSRKEVQKRAEDYIFSHYIPGDIIPARVTRLDPFGAFVDIGCGIISLLGIETLSVSRSAHPADRFCVGDNIFVVITGFDTENRRVFLSHRELLGTWEENAARFSPGRAVKGIVRGLPDYGIFIELAPNLSGLAEPCEGFSVGDVVSVFIKSITPEKAKIKLVIIEKLPRCLPTTLSTSDYFITGGHIEHWEYSSSDSKKKISSVF